MSRLDAKFLRRFFVDETPSGTVNGSNTAFTLSQIPFDADDSVQVFLDGLKQTRVTDYTVSGSTVTFVVAPALGQSIRVNYVQFQGEDA